MEPNGKSDTGSKLKLPQIVLSDYDISNTLGTGIL